MMIAAFSLSDEAPFPEDVFEVGEKYYVIKFGGRAPVLEEDFEKQRETLAEKYLQQKKNSYLEQWTENAQAHTKILVRENMVR